MLKEAEEYKKALKTGKKEARQRLMYGEDPYIPVLENILPQSKIQSQESLGLIEIPLSRIAGTAFGGRQNCFSWGFMPLMPENSEFATKWITLCHAHETEGIQDSIVAFEYMNRYYVVEGHKRVSLLKYFGAASIAGRVTRMIPKPEDTKEYRLYSEFLNFYRISKQMDVIFTEEGGYLKLIQLIHGKNPKKQVFSQPPEPEVTLPSAGAPAGESQPPETSPALPWSAKRQTEFHAFFSSFSLAFEELAGDRLRITPADALLLYLSVFPYEESKNKTGPELKKELTLIWSEIENRDKQEDIRLILRPNDHRALFPSLSSGIKKIAFLHNRNQEVSSWVYAHELGRKELENAFDGRVETFSLSDIDSEEQADAAFEEAISQGADLIFTTSPVLLNASVRASLANPKVKILNCSLNTSHPTVRTYYARMYEAKFLLGIIAGSMAEDDRIGYIADYPIYGSTANINAFAIGAQMVNPRAKVYLEWSKTFGEDSRDRLGRDGISYYSDLDLLTPNREDSPRKGLYRYADGKVLNMAETVWRWDRLYIRIAQSLENGGWKTDGPDSLAVGYWWGMDAGVLEVTPAEGLPEGLSRTLCLFRDHLIAGSLTPFSGRITDQTGLLHDYRFRPMTPKEIITMNWLNENVVGSLPEYSELIPEAKNLVKIQGLQMPGSAVTQS